MPTTTNSTQYANRVASPQVMNPSQYAGAQLRVMSAMITYASQASGDIVNLFKLPAGARVVGINIQVSVTFGGTATLKIGDAGDDDKYRAAAIVAVSEWNVLALAGTAATDAAGVVGSDAPYAAETLIFATVGAASAPASGRMIINFFYVEAA